METLIDPAEERGQADYHWTAGERYLLAMIVSSCITTPKGRRDDGARVQHFFDSFFLNVRREKWSTIRKEKRWYCISHSGSIICFINENAKYQAGLDSIGGQYVSFNLVFARAAG